MQDTQILVSDFPDMWTNLLSRFRRHLHEYFSNFFGTRDPSRSLSQELCFVFQFSSSQTPATHRTIDAVHSWVIDEGLNLKHFPKNWKLQDVLERSVFAFPFATCNSVHKL